MIFVTVGSAAPFDSLIEKIDGLVGAGVLVDVVAQIGNGTYTPKNIKWFRFEKDLTDYFSSANLVIAHAGAGTIFEILKLKGKVIAIPNPTTVQSKNIDFVFKLSEDGYILKCLEIDRLEETIRIAANWVPKPFEFPECTIPNIIKEFLLGPAK